MFEHPLHPVVVHFPIALLSTAVLFELLGFLLRRDDFRRFGFWLLILGLTGGIVAAGFGLWGEGAALKMGVPEKAIDRHESFAVTTLITFGLLLIYRWRIRDRWTPGHNRIYLSGALAGLLLLGTTGFFGSELVYRYGAGVQKEATRLPVTPELRPSTDPAEKK
jgi:uncharacterized membrane protein